jgi:hypothetical protein
MKGIYLTEEGKKEIESNINKSKTNIYFASPIEGLDLSVLSTHFIDSVGKFNINDTISFQLHH